MSTWKTRDSERKGFLRLHKELGGVVPSVLPHNTSIMIDTREFMYEIIVKKDNTPTPKYEVSTGSPLCAKNETLVTGITSRDHKMGFEIDDWVGFNTTLILQYEGGTSILTGIVKEAIIMGTSEDGNKYTYEVWNKND